MPDNLGLGGSLHNPHNASIDIVFVHGLCGDRKATWTNENGVFWPRDLLPKDIQEARICSFGYEAAVAKLREPPSDSNLENHADSLVAVLAGLRAKTRTADLPIIFVAHSLGGLVCAKAMLKAEGKPPSESQMVQRNTRGVAFLGTPFRGSEQATYTDIFRRLISVFKSTNHLLEDLKPGHSLSEPAHDFSQWLRKRSEESDSKVRVALFFEEFVMPEFSEKVVSQESATIEGYKPLKLHANHVDMCKFDSSQDSSYVAIADILRQWAEEIGSTKKAEKPELEAQSNSKVSNKGTNTGSMAGQQSSSGSASQNFGGK